MTRPTRYWTVKQWNKVKKVHEKHIGDKVYYLDMQEVLCRRYDIILVDYRTRKEKIVGVLKAINFKNFDKGMLIFDNAMKEFDKAMKDFGKELGDSKISHQKITGKQSSGSSVKFNLWGNTKKSKINSMDIWSSPKPKKRKKTKKKKKTNQSKSVDEMIWGKKK